MNIWYNKSTLYTAPADDVRTINHVPWGFKLAQKIFRSNWCRKRMVAVYIEGNTILIESNSTKTSPEAARQGYSGCRQHAEFSVLRRVENGSKGKLYVYREHANGTLAQAAPCVLCRKLIASKNIKNVYYTIEGGYAKEVFT